MDRTERIPEIALSAAWHAGQIPEFLTTTAGDSVRVVHRGSWTHGLGPDFADALLLFNGRELRSGSIEMHLETRGWHEHGHQLNAAYNAVILHVVARHDGEPTRRADGGLVPVVEAGLPDMSHLPMALMDWDRVGGSVCAPRLARSSPEKLREVLRALGDARLSARSAQVEATLLDAPPAEALWHAILGALGYSRNQVPMRRLAERFPLAGLDEARHTQPPERRFHTTLGLLLGAAGFLPLSPGEAHLIKLGSVEVRQVEAAWQSLGTPWHGERLRAEEWERARTRPANHPLPRLHAAAAIVHNSERAGGVYASILSALRTDHPVKCIRDLTQFGEMPGIGEDRGIEMLASGVLPVLFGVASQTEDELLAAMAAHVWDTLPAPATTSVTQRAIRQVAGDVPLRRLGARGAQGLIQLDTALCLPRRCFECPVAAAELAVNE